MLSDDRIAEMMRDTWGCASIAPRHAEAFARSVEAEVRKDDEALMRQTREALMNEQIQDLLLCGNPTDEEMRLIRIGGEAARGIKGGQP